MMVSYFWSGFELVLGAAAGIAIVIAVVVTVAALILELVSR